MIDEKVLSKEEWEIFAQAKFVMQDLNGNVGNFTNIYLQLFLAYEHHKICPHTMLKGIKENILPEYTQEKPHQARPTYAKLMEHEPMKSKGIMVDIYV